jgi:hypothetical protein
MKNMVIGVMGLLLILQTAYLLVGSKETPSDSKQPPAAVPVEEAAIASPALSDALNESKSADNNQQLEKAHNLIASLYEQNQQLEEDAKPSLKKGIEQMVESPEMKGMLSNRAKREAKRKYAGLLNRLNLSPEQKAKLNELFIQREKAEMSTGMSWMMGDVDTALAQSLVARDQTHQQIEQEFGQQTLDAYRYWEDTEDQRTAVNRMNQKLGAGGVDEETSDRLVGMMYETHGRFEELDHLSQPENFNPRDFNPEYRDSILGQVDDLHETYVYNAQNDLTPDQLTQFETTLQQQRRELDQFLRFTYQAVK